MVFGDIWTDIRIAFIILIFIVLVDFIFSKKGISKNLAILMAAVIAFLTFYSHTELLIISVAAIFMIPFIQNVLAGMSPPAAK